MEQTLQKNGVLSCTVKDNSETFVLEYVVTG